jgi:copper resistance protein B
MKTRTCLLWVCLWVSTGAAAGAQDDPILFKAMIDKLEWREADGDNPVAWDADGWLGKDLHKLWIKTEGEHAGGKTESAYAEAFYSRAVAPYWDLQVGWRHDFEPAQNRDWLAVGFKGLAPYWFEVDTTLYAGGNGSVAARLDLEYELLFTQRLVLTPELELNAYGKDDPVRGIGSGLSDLELGLRLRYELRREFAPYVGINWEKKLGDSADFARDEGESSSDLQFVMGVRAWF